MEYFDWDCARAPLSGGSGADPVFKRKQLRSTSETRTSDKFRDHPRAPRAAQRATESHRLAEGLAKGLDAGLAAGLAKGLDKRLDA